MTLDIFIDIIITIMFHGRIVITHTKDIFSDICTIKVFTTNIIMVLRYYNFLIVKLKKMKEDTIEGSFIEDIL